MNKQAPVVAELGRPETAQETADRKAAATKAYRSSQTVRNLIAALIATLAIVAVIVFAVPRGTAPEREPIDVAGIAAEVESTVQSPTLVTQDVAGYQVNAAVLEGSAPSVWKVTLAPSAEDARGFINVAQAFDADASWAPRMVGGIAPTGEVTLEGRTWDEYEIPNPSDSANVSYALGTQAGDDYILLFGALSPEKTASIAETLSVQIEKIAAAE